MKPIITAVVMVGVTTSLAFAGLSIIDRKKKPSVSLSNAYQFAVKALGSATNDYHCVSAQFIGSRCSSGSWMFSFWNTNGALKTVFACADGSAFIENGPPRF